MKAFWKARRSASASAVAAPVAFIGDSITFSWSEVSERPGLVNRGVPCETTRQIRQRFEAQVLLGGAAGVHILAGVNDIAGNGCDIPLNETRANLRAMAIAARASGLRVWLGSVLPVDGIWWAPGVTDAPAQILELNRGLAADAGAAEVGYIDYHEALATPAGGLRPEFSADGVHLSPAGYARITPLALAALGAP